MSTPPTPVTYAEATDWTPRTATNATPSISWAAGDLIVVVAVASNVSNSNITAVTATGLTFTALQNMVDGNSAPSVSIWAATAAAAGADVITATQSGAVDMGLAAWVFTGSDGVGASVASTGPGAASGLALTRTGDDSMVIAGVFAWESALPAVTWEPAGQTQRRAVLTGGYLQLLADWPDQGPAGTTTYGASSAGTATNFVVVAAEILGTASTGTTVQLGAVTEINSAPTPPVATASRINLPTTAELDSVPALAPGKTATIAAAAEIDEALNLAAGKTTALQPATETDTAPPLSSPAQTIEALIVGEITGPALATHVTGPKLAPAPAVSGPKVATTVTGPAIATKVTGPGV